MKTVEELDGAPPQGTFVQAFDAGHPNPDAPIPGGAPTIYASPIYQAQAYPATIQQTAYAAPCGPVACGTPPPVVYAPPAPPQVI